MAANQNGEPWVGSVDDSPAESFPDILRAWVDVPDRTMEEGVDRTASGPMSPELVLVDPVLRSRVAELPTGPSLPPPILIAEGEAPPAPAEQPRGLGLVASVAYVLALVLALPVLAMAADFMRSGGPRLAPPVATSGSGQAHVSLQKHVVTNGSRSQVVQRSRPR
jgi:hypothetical protein